MCADGCASSTLPVFVPLGSVLGPLLFISYINDIIVTAVFSENTFADDIALYRIIET